MSILTTAFGKPFAKAGFGNYMAAAIHDAGLPCGPDVLQSERCVTHGLRKAAARRLAEAGCSAREIMSVTGHTSLKEAQRYTEDADQERLADEAIGRLTSERRFPNL